MNIKSVLGTANHPLPHAKIENHPLTQVTILKAGRLFGRGEHAKLLRSIKGCIKYLDGCQDCRARAGLEMCGGLLRLAKK